MASAWGGSNSPDPFLATDWASYSVMDPLGQKTSGSNMYSLPQMYTYDQRQSSSWGAEYDPAYGRYTSNYDPSSGYTSKIIDANIQQWMQAEFPELYNFDSGVVNSGSGGDVSQNPSFGQFGKDPSVYQEIAAAANKYGIPSNLLKVMIARESSGDWESNSTPVYLSTRGQRIHGYVGILEDTAAAWGYDFDQMVGNRALQIDAMANGLSRLYQDYGGEYGWDGVIAVYYSGDPTQTYTPPDSYQHGTTAEYVRQVKGWWADEDAWVKANGGTVGSGGTVSGVGQINNPDWEKVNSQNAVVTRVANETGAPGNLVKSVFRASEGIPDSDPVLAMAGINAHYQKTGSWEVAAKQYAYENGVDPNDYWRKLNSYWEELDAAVSGTYGGDAGDMGPVTSIGAIWGNAPGVTVSQGHFEVNDWVLDNTSVHLGGRKTGGRGMYDYSVEQFGHMGHPGIDYAMPTETRIYSPVGGTVELVGGSYYQDSRYGGASQTGELRIRLDNGHQIIFGHMGGIHVSVGDRIQPGTYVGLSGTAGTGPHLHLEYRVEDPPGSARWMAVNPEDALRGNFSGTFSGNTSGAGKSRPMTLQEMLKASASGSPIYGGSTLSSPNTWNTFLQDAMQGLIPNTRDDSVSAMRSGGVQNAYGGR